MIEGKSFDIPLNFLREHVLHDLTKYFIVTWVDEKANKDLNSEFSRLSNLPFSTP